MTTDELRRMLELAARACGIHLHHWFEAHGCYMASSIKGGDPDFGWCPDEDDGDSAKMRTALRMNVIWSDTAVHCLNSMGEAFESFADHNNDRNAALRLCALRVAAAIGENTQ